MNIDKKKLQSVAEETRQYAATFRSEHKIGAAVLTDTGEIFGGCNLESIVSGLGTCAERGAVINMLVHGIHAPEALYVTENLIPCGACLQYLFEFSQDCIILNEGEEVFNIRDLLPRGYVSRNNKEKIGNMVSAK